MNELKKVMEQDKMVGWESVIVYVGMNDLKQRHTNINHIMGDI